MNRLAPVQKKTLTLTKPKPNPKGPVPSSSDKTLHIRLITSTQDTKQHRTILIITLILATNTGLITLII